MPNRMVWGLGGHRRGLCIPQVCGRSAPKCSSRRETPMRKFLVLSAMVLSVVSGAAIVVPAASAAVLNVSLAGSGTGTVTSNPTGINCSNIPGSANTTCSHDFGPFFGTGQLTAVPGEGFAFLGWSGSAGGTCDTGVANPCTTGFLFFGTLATTATFVPAPDPPTATTGGVDHTSFPSAKVTGTVNPNSDDFAIKECYFEYGLTTDYGEKAACRPSIVGTGTSPVAVSASVGVLESGRTYHYRLVSVNGGGAGRGEDRTFTSDNAPEDDCPNAAIRVQQGVLAQRLPDCGAYEMVSPLFTAGQRVAVSVGTADGTRVVLASAGGFAGTENLSDTVVNYATERTEVGWNTSAIAPPASVFPFMGGSYAALDWMRDGSRSLWFVNLKADEGTSRFTPIVRDPDGSFHVAGVTQDDIAGGGEPLMPVATSEDLSTVLQVTYTRPLLTDGTTDSRSQNPRTRSLYVTTRGADGHLRSRQVAHRAGTTMFPDCEVTPGGSSAGANITARNAVSRDGRKIFFTAMCNTPAAQRVWAKIGDDDPIDLSASACQPTSTCGPERTATFRGASRDGSRVYFTTEQQLVPEDEDTFEQNDLYEYDFEASVGNRLRLVTGGPAEAGANVRSVMRISNDGAYVYFIALGRALTGANERGAAPQPGSPNVYVYHRGAGQAEGTTTFVGTLEANYQPIAQASSSGRFFLFQTAANLTGEKLAGDQHPDLFRYDADEDELLRVWTDDPDRNGSARIGGAIVAGVPEAAGGNPAGGMQRSAGWYNELQLSDDGSKVGFTTLEPLSRDDRNAATDAYLWRSETGQMTMLTDGTSRPANRFSGSGFVGMTPSGDSQFVLSASPLLRAHTSGQGAVYVVRSGGGFPEAPAPANPCSGDVCQPPTSPPSVRSGAEGSSTFAGPGNVLLAAPKPGATVRSGKAKTVRGSSTRIAVKVSGRGKVQVSGSNLARTSEPAGKAGSVRVTVQLSKQGQRVLRSKGRVKTRASVRFSPASGKAVTTHLSVTFKAKPKKSKLKASSRSKRELGVLSSDVQKGR